MIKKLTAIGNSYGLIIDRSILELLKIEPDAELELSTDGTRLIVEPVGRRGRPRPAPPPARPPRARPREPRFGIPRKPPW